MTSAFSYYLLHCSNFRWDPFRYKFVYIHSMFTQARKTLSTVDSRTWREEMAEGKRGKAGGRKTSFLPYRKRYHPLLFFIKQVALQGQNWLPQSIIGMLQIVVGHWPWAICICWRRAKYSVLTCVKPGLLAFGKMILTQIKETYYATDILRI